MIARREDKLAEAAPQKRGLGSLSATAADLTVRALSGCAGRRRAGRAARSDSR